MCRAKRFTTLIATIATIDITANPDADDLDCVASLRGYAGWSVYAASKALLPAYARVWVAELRDRKTRVNVRTPARSPRR